MGGYLPRVFPHRILRLRHLVGDDTQWLLPLRDIRVHSFKIPHKLLSLSKTEFIMTKRRKITIAVITVIVLLGVLRLIPNRSFDIDTRELLEYCRSKGLSDEYCILVDFSKPQGVDRFAIYSFRDNAVIAKSLCAQGRGRENNIFCRKFSNEIGSNYSSLGHYRVGRLRPMSHPILWFFNDGYEVHGLDSTNSNAYKRAILIHNGNACFETYPLPCIPASQGCFTVSTAMMRKIAEIKKLTDKPLLLYAYR